MLIKALSPSSRLLQRSEIVAMMNTLYRFSESLHAIEQFRKMWKQLDKSESRTIVENVEKNTAPKVRLYKFAEPSTS